MQMSLIDCYARSYSAARVRFLGAAERAGAETTSHRHPSETGPDGEALYIDSAWLGPAEPAVVVLCLSGTHGAEGFCGSALQVAALEQGLRPKRDDVAILHIHAVNPFGFAHMVRCNERNVDLNRNWIDFAQRPVNPIYARVDARLPRRGGFDEALVDEWLMVFDDARREFGEPAFDDAISRGQYEFADGVQFGGFEPEWSSRTLSEIIAARCGTVRHVAYTDFHSLVRIGDGHLLYLCFNETDDPLYRRAASWWGAGSIDRRQVAAQWSDGVSRGAGRPSRHGLLMWGMQHLFAPRADLAGAVIEFCADGESPRRDDVRELVAQRYLMTRPGVGPEVARLRAWLEQLYCPPSRSFRERTLEAALGAFEQALRGAHLWAEENTAPAVGRLVRSASFE